MSTHPCSERWLDVGGVLLCMAGAAGCSSSVEPGVSVSVIAALAPLEPEAVVRLDERTEIRVSYAAWTSAEIEIIACASLAERLQGLLLRPAWAHGVAAPTRSAVPVIQSASQAPPVELGHLAPPAQDYCSANQRLGPADADAVGLADNPDMLGHSVRVRGMLRRDDGPWRELEVASRAERLVSRTDLALDLTRAGASATLRVESDLAEWFVGMRFDEGAATEEQEQQLLDNIAASVRIAVE